MAENTRKSSDHDALTYFESFITKPALVPGVSQAERLEIIRLHIPRMRYFLHALGNPQNRYHILHVGGTSGKGSTSAILAEILHAAGYRTGLHTKPYLQTPLEKFIINGRMATLAEFAHFVAAFKPIAETVIAESPLGKPDRVAMWVAATLTYFAAAQVDFAVIEVGMGGRYDHTNTIQPVVSVITTITYDHTEVLGKTLPEIAWHKAGMIKKGVPTVTAVHQPDLVEILRTECEHQGSPLFQVGKDTRYEVQRVDLDGGRFDFYGLDGTKWSDLRVSMLGAHQVLNAATAITTLQVMQRFSQIEIPEGVIRAGLEQARIPGRMEIVQRRPLVLLDGAHNLEKMETLRLALEHLFPGKRLILVIGTMAVKGFGTVSTIAPSADRIVATMAHIKGKEFVPPEEIERFALEQGFSGESVTSEPDPIKAVERALAMAMPDDLICVTGSLYLVGQVREIWFPTNSLGFG